MLFINLVLAKQRGRHFNMNKCSICWYEFHLQIASITLILSNDSSALSSGSVRPVRAQIFRRNETPLCNLTLLCCEEKKHLSSEAHCSLYCMSKKLQLSPPSLMTTDKCSVFLWCISCSPQHRAETAWHRTQRVWWIEGYAAALTPFALYFMKWTSGLEINRPPLWMRTTVLGPYQESAANLWQAEPAPSLDTPLVFEIKVDACNPGKWSLYSCLTPV